MSDDLFVCAITHEDGLHPKADWAWIGEGGDVFLCDYHYRLLARPNPEWQPIL